MADNVKEEKKAKKAKGKDKEKDKIERHSFLHVIKNIWFMFKYADRFYPSYKFVVLGEAIGRAIWHIFVTILYVLYIFDALETARPFKEILFYTSLMAAYTLIFELFNKWRLQVYNRRAHLTVHEKMQYEMYKKARAMDQECYDDPEFYDDFIWALRESDQRIIHIMEDLSIFINRVISTIAVIGILLKIDAFVAFAVVLSISLSFAIKKKLNKLRFDHKVENNPLVRKQSYVNRVFYIPDYVKEIRQKGVPEMLWQEYDEATEEMVKLKKKYNKKIYPLILLEETVTNYLFDLMITGYLIVRYALNTGLSLGSMFAAQTSVWKLYWQLQSMSRYINKFNEHSIYVDKLRKFIEYQPKIVGGDKIPAEFESLELKNVSFCYPFDKEKKTVLSDLNIKIVKGEKVALVGYNGAGKTTLTKLIMRLYEPTEGEILYNGINIKEYDINAYREHIGAVFQDYKIFAASLAENVLGGEYTEDKRETVLSALKSASFDNKLSELENGIDTQLTKEFDKSGVSLSGGETQKVAISRVFAHSYQLVIMDEPSSALDPIAEYELNNSIIRDTLGKTVIFISHRLSTTRMADRIYMFSEGRLIEEGSHGELMAMNGRYSEMYLTQAEKYNI